MEEAPWSIWEEHNIKQIFLGEEALQTQDKECALVAEHLNEFNIITSQLASIKITTDDEIKAILLMCSMQDS